MASESIQPDITQRTIRAATEYMTIIEKAPALFDVVSESGAAYTVDLREPACSCRDFLYRDNIAACKHLTRVRLEVGQVDIDALEHRLAATAEQLGATASELEDEACEIEEAARELQKARTRLREVVE